jgi:DNA-binding PadR family transcriptional regulator
MPRSSHSSPQTLRVLDLLLQEPEGWHYGYDVSRRTGLKTGTLYPILIRLAEQGWLETRWEEPRRPGRPPRHAYRLTAEGAREARSTLQRARERQPNLRPEREGTAG